MLRSSKLLRLMHSLCSMYLETFVWMTHRNFWSGMLKDEWYWDYSCCNVCGSDSNS